MAQKDITIIGTLVHQPQKIDSQNYKSLLPKVPIDIQTADRVSILRSLYNQDSFLDYYSNHMYFIANPTRSFDPDVFDPTIIDVYYAYGEQTAYLFMAGIIDSIVSCCKSSFSSQDMFRTIKELMLQPKARVIKITEWIWFAYAFRMSDLGKLYGELTPKALTEAYQQFLIYRRDKRHDAIEQSKRDKKI